MDKYIGKRLDARYEINDLIGVGGMSLVYKAYDIIEAKNVAIKILRDEYFGNKEFMRRFRNESKAVTMLSHPNIVKILNVSFGTNFQYIVMEYISGMTLKEYIIQKKGINWKEAIVIIKQVLQALSHAHSKGIIHRDVKPQNIMILNDGGVKVTDFGIARFSSNATQTISDKTIGSVHYISPEQAKGQSISFNSDIYSIGVVLYEMLTNRLPFESDNAVSVAIMQLQVTPQAPRMINPSIPPALEEIVLKAMQKKPENRYFAAQNMLDDISEFEKNQNIHFGYSCFVDDSPTKVLEGRSFAEEEFEENSKRKKAILIISGIATSMVLVALAFMFVTMFTPFGSSKSVDIPNFIGMPVSDVKNDDQYKFKFQVENVYDPSKNEGVIIDQNPKAGSKKIKANSSITLKVNSSKISVDVPKVVGLSEDEAKARLSSAGFSYEINYVDDSKVPAGEIKASDPSENHKAPAGSSVILYVSKGKPANIRVANVIGESLDSARSILESQGLSVSETKYEPSNREKDIVILSDPLPGVAVSPGTGVVLTLSSGIKKQKTVSLTVDWSDQEPFKDDVVLKVYVDGELDSSKTTIVDPSVTRKVFQFQGTKGEKEIKVKFNDTFTRTYYIEF